MQSKYFQIILLAILLSTSSYAKAWVLEDQKLQIIYQAQVAKASKDFQISRYNQIQANLKLEQINTQIIQMQANHNMQDEIKSKMLDNMYQKRNKLSKHLNRVSDQIDCMGLLTSGVGYSSSLKLQMLYSNSFNYANQVFHLLKGAFSSKTDVYHMHNYSFAVSPKITFSSNMPLEYEIRFIIFYHLQKPKYKRFFEVQLASNFKKFSTQYCIDITNGYKFSNNIMLLWQTFCSIEPQNPIKMYKNTMKNQISIVKCFETRSINLQVGYFSYNFSNNYSKSIANGFLVGVWMEN